MENEAMLCIFKKKKNYLQKKLTMENEANVNKKEEFFIEQISNGLHSIQDVNKMSLIASPNSCHLHNQTFIRKLHSF